MRRSERLTAAEAVRAIEAAMPRDTDADRAEEIGGITAQVIGAWRRTPERVLHSRTTERVLRFAARHQIAVRA